MILPEGFALPPLPYLLVLLVAVGTVAGLLWRRQPRVSERLVVAFAPWVVVGSTLHALYQLRLIPAAVRPFFGTPSVYLTTFVAAGSVWLLALESRRLRSFPTPRVLGATGVLVTFPLVGAVLWYGVQNDSLQLFWPFIGLVVAVLLTAAVWTVTGYVLPDVVMETGAVGALALFGHALDSVSTAIGVDVLGFGERTPVSRAVLEFAGTLSTADALGVGWLFVLVKLAVAVLVVVLFTDYVREEPTEGYLLLAFVAAVGLGPGVYNLLLFSVAG